MLLDYEQELTVEGGHDLAFAAGTEYGSRPYDQKIPVGGLKDPGVGEPLSVFIDTIVNAATFDDLTVAIVLDDDGAGNGEEVLVSKTFLDTELTTALGVQRVGIIPPGLLAAYAANYDQRYLSARLTITGATGTGKVKVFLGKASDFAPANAANHI